LESLLVRTAMAIMTKVSAAAAAVIVVAGSVMAGMAIPGVVVVELFSSSSLQCIGVIVGTGVVTMGIFLFERGVPN